MQEAVWYSVTATQGSGRRGWSALVCYAIQRVKSTSVYILVYCFSVQILMSVQKTLITALSCVTTLMGDLIAPVSMVTH